MLARIAARSVSASLLRSRPVAHSLLAGTWRAAAFSSSALLDWSKLAVGDIEKMDTETVVRHLKDTLGLEQEDLDVLKKQKVSGKVLLGLNKEKMVRVGLSLGAMEGLLPLCLKLPNKSAKTVKVNLAPQSGAGEDSIREYTFETAEVFDAFLVRQGAASMCNGDRKGIDASQFKLLKEGCTYTLDFAKGGYKTDVMKLKDHNDSSEKVVVESCKYAVARQSEEVFKAVLKPHGKIDLNLTVDGEKAGDVDILFKSDPPGLHVLLERKRRIPSAAAAKSVKKQVAATAGAYTGSDYYDSKSQIKSMVFAEAIAPEAVSVLRDAGIYVLSTADMRVLAPTRSSEQGPSGARS